MKPEFRILSLVLAIVLSSAIASADPHAGQSENVVIVGGTTLDTGNCAGSGSQANNMGYTYGGCLPVNGSAGELGDFKFSAMAPSAVSAVSLSSYDTIVLNMASSSIACNPNSLSDQSKADIIAAVGTGKKLIIFDSECTAPGGGGLDYSWLPYPFTTANPGAMGASGTLTIVEENTLSTSNPADTHYIDAVHLGSYTDAIGDMNVMTTYNPNWCLDMSGTNALQVSGPVHTYAKYPSGTDEGLIIYNGMDQDEQGYNINDPQLRKVWLQELQQPFNPSSLPCGFTVVGITLSPLTATNDVGTSHTVTAKVTDVLGNPISGMLVTFSVISGPNAGATGTGTTDANGEATFTYSDTGGAGTDTIEASFVNQQQQTVVSNQVTKIWKPGTSVPEFPAVALPVISILGMIFVISRRKN